jgi:hypothetical protein
MFHPVPVVIAGGIGDSFHASAQSNAPQRAVPIKYLGTRRKHFTISRRK